MCKTVDEILAEFTSHYGPEEVWVLSLSDAEIVERLRATGHQSCTTFADYLESLFAREHVDPASIKRELEEHVRSSPGSRESWPDRNDRTASGLDAWVAYHLANGRSIARRLILDWVKQERYFSSVAPSDPE
ncbi:MULTISPECIES: hypothetical protein [Sorangium]|uniref:Uncharacterized protein n=1 Tax=Sorangium cellulosum (strain So ce56) TaxID=448385 RepID=A9FQL6_SORC5|nr:hypothetical protein [Sorangium cellulosum]CAN92169.1 hypothetical protein predicted by Glimmer/Critica [Sorangium cellulosum So ce56]